MESSEGKEAVTRTVEPGVRTPPTARSALREIVVVTSPGGIDNDDPVDWNAEGVVKRARINC